jgi:hypothetical protein
MLQPKTKLTQVVLTSLILTTSLLISGCGSTPIKKIEVSAEPIEKAPLMLPKTDRLRMREVKWMLITRENYQQVFDELSKNKKDVVLFGLTDDGYEALSLNTSDILRIIEQKNAVIAAYQGYYEKTNSAIEDTNKKIQQDKQAADAVNSKDSEPGFFDRLFK